MYGDEERAVHWERFDPMDPLYVTRPQLPPLEELTLLLEEIWRERVLTNSGPIHQRFERTLADYLGVSHLSLVVNATQGLLLALMGLGRKGEVITTPFTFVGTAHAIVQAGLTPVFVDIDPSTMNLDPKLVESAITERTCAILPVHCFGYACDVSSLGAIAKKYDLSLVYDAAHAFGVKDAGGSLLRHGDASVVSFHATKVFTTFEGGAIVCATEETKRTIDRLKNYGFDDQNSIDLIGTNAKMTEFSAAMGLLELKYVQARIDQRALRDAVYRESLEDVRGVHCPKWPAGQSRNYYNFPIFVGDDFPLKRDELAQKLLDRGIVARRYFYPLVTDLPVYRRLFDAQRSLPVARDVAERVLCLPLYPDLPESDQRRVVAAIRDT